MKKIVLLVALVAICFGASAQGFSYGIKAGMNVSSIGGKDIEDSKNKIGWFAGVVTEIKFSEKFGVAPELLYSNQGVKFDYDGDKSTFKGDYINLPIFAKYYITNNLSVGVGPQFGYAVSIKSKEDGNSVKLETSEYNAFEVAIGVSATYKFGGMFVDARYNYGLTKVMKDFKNYNRVFQLGVGYMF